MEWIPHHRGYTILASNLQRVLDVLQRVNTTRRDHEEGSKNVFRCLQKQID